MSELFESVTQSWWGWIAPLTVQFTALALVLGCVERALPRRVSTCVRAAILWAIFLRLCLPPTLTSPLGIVEALGDSAVAPLAVDSIAGVSGGWVGFAFAIWLSGVSLAVSFGILRATRERTAWLARAQAASAHVLAIAAAAARDLGIAGTPRVVTAPHARGPATVGMVRPKVVLPVEFAETAPERDVRNVLLHELAHVARRDAWAALAWTAARAIFWFHPLVHWTARRAATLREIACDELAVRASGGCSTYRRTLLEHARQLVQPTIAGVSRFAPARAEILARLEALDRPRGSSVIKDRSLATTTFALLAISCVPLARREVMQIPELDDLQGCLRKRYAVLAALAGETQSTALKSNVRSHDSRKESP